MDKRKEKPFVSVVIAASGSSTRMGKDVNKLLLSLEGIPIIIRTIMCFENNDIIDEIIVSCRECDIFEYANLFENFMIRKVKKIIRGGKTRTKSVLNGINACNENSEFVAIHDGARPLISQELITNVINDAFEYGAAAPVVKCKDSIKRIDNGFISNDINREKIAAVQTPQVFKTEIIKKALESAVKKDISFTDDCTAAEKAGVSIYASNGDYKNIKITTPDDILVAQMLINEIYEV